MHPLWKTNDPGLYPRSSVSSLMFPFKLPALLGGIGSRRLTMERCKVNEIGTAASYEADIHAFHIKLLIEKKLISLYQINVRCNAAKSRFSSLTTPSFGVIR